MADATGTEPDEWVVWRAFLAANAQLGLEIDRRLKQSHDLAQGEYATLAALRDAGGRLRVGRLAVLLGWEKSRTSHLVARMEARQLVSRAASPRDGRATEIVLTAQGTKALLGAVRSHAADVRALFFDQMDSHERKVLGAVLERVLHNLRPSAE